MKFRYVNQLTNKPSVEMSLYSEIGGDAGINAQQFADELNYIENYTDAQVVNVRICSEGGLVMSGVAIFSAIANANKRGKIQVNTYNDGVCASIAGIILLAGKERFGKPFARTMIHGVSFGDEKNLTANDLANKTAFESMLNDMFTASTNKSSKFYSGLMSNGKDNWFDFDEALSVGILTGPEPDGDENDPALEPEVVGDLSTSAPTPGARPGDIKSYRQKVVAVYNQLNNNKNSDMKKIIMKLNGRVNAKTKLAEASNENEVEAVVAEVIDENVKLTNDLTAEKLETERLKKENDALGTEAATTEVKAAIAAGKFDKNAEATLIAQAKKDLPAFRGLVAATNSPAANITRMINREGAHDVAGLAEKVNGKNFREIEKMDKGKTLAALKASNKALYVTLYNECYKTAKTEADF